MSVAVGCTRTIETGLPATCSSSTRSASVKPFTACLEAEYIPCNGMTASDTSLPTLTSTPPLARRNGNAASEPLTTPQKFTSNKRRLSASETSSRRP